MPTINFVGLDWYSFSINTERTFCIYGVSGLSDLKCEVCTHLRNRIKAQFCNERGINTNLDVSDIFGSFCRSPLFKKWLNVNKSKYIQLIFNETILTEDNFESIDLQSGDTITYIILPRVE